MDQYLLNINIYPQNKKKDQNNLQFTTTIVDTQILLSQTYFVQLC